MRPEAYLYPSLRAFLLLDGEWFVIRDPKNIGIKQKWFSLDKDLIQSSQTIRAYVPACWQTYGEEFLDYSGVVWYFREFQWQNEKKADNFTVLLDCTAIDFRAEIWLNGHKIGKHEGGYSRFVVELSSFIQEGNNLLVIRVEDPKDLSKIPHGKQGKPWYSNISGIWGSIYVETIYAPVFLDDIFIKSNESLDAVSLQFQLKSSENDSITEKELSALKISGEIRFQDEIVSNFEKKLVDCEPKTQSRTSFTTFNFEIGKIPIPDPKHWSPEEPHLYTCRLHLYGKNQEILDVVDIEFGLRKIEKKDGLIYLNNKPLLLKGVLDQAFHPLTLYNYPLTDGKPDEFIKKEIMMIKEAGFNLTRKHLKVEDPRYIYWCDHLGLLYWEEMPNFSKLCRYSKNIFKQELEAMVKRDRNHPSIIIWGIFNENWGIPLLWFNVNNKLVKKLFSLVRQLDSSRLIVDNSGWAHDKSTTDINDYHCYYLAPESATIWSKMAKFILSNPEKNFRTKTKKSEAKKLPIILSEFGHAGLPDIERLEKSKTLTRKNVPEYFRRGQEYPIIGGVKPEGWRERYERLSRHFLKDIGTAGKIAELDQYKEWLSNKYIIEELRISRGLENNRFSGYIITQFTDLEWEYNG
ncbi:MAG: glycoside hydrolase family 2 protein, partial [Candidatus Heimdallarchaeaceae archaeon]